jgi:hypothetical protein
VNGVTIDSADAADRDAIAALIEHCGLPLEGLADHWSNAIVAKRSGRVVVADSRPSAPRSRAAKPEWDAAI